MQPREPSVVGAPERPQPPSQAVNDRVALMTGGRHAPQMTDHRPIDHQPELTSRPEQPQSSHKKAWLWSPCSMKGAGGSALAPAEPWVTLGGRPRWSSPQLTADQFDSRITLPRSQRLEARGTTCGRWLSPIATWQRSRRDHSCKLAAVLAVRSCQEVWSLHGAKFRICEVRSAAATW